MKASEPTADELADRITALKAAQAASHLLPGDFRDRVARRQGWEPGPG